MATLNDFLKKGNNVIVISTTDKEARKGGAFIWGSNFEDFKYPFDQKVAVPTGTKLWNESQYAKKQLGTNALNPCYGIRKAIYKAFWARKMNLMFCYEYEGSMWMDYKGGYLKEFTDLIERKATETSSVTYMHLTCGQVSYGCVSEDGFDKKLEYGPISQGKQTPASYFYAMLNYFWESDVKTPELFKNKLRNDLEDLYEAFNAGTLGTEENLQKLTVFENDFLMCLAEYQNTKKVAVFEDSYIVKSHDTAPEARCIFGGESDEIVETKPKTEIKIIRKVGDVAKSGLYKIAHTFAPGDETLVPGSEYADMVLTPQVEEVCALIKSKEFMPTSMNMNFMFTGEAGTGKSTAAAQIAALTGLPYRFLTCSSGTEETELKVQTIINPNDGSKFLNVDSEIVKAVKYGGVIEVQEINMIRREGVAACLNSVLDGIGKMKLLDGSIITRHPNCIFIFTMNVGYEGARNLNQALLSRCFCKEEFEIPTKDELVCRIIDKQKLDKNLASQMVSVFFEVRKVLEEAGETNGVCSWRELEAWAEMLARNKEIRKRIDSIPELKPYYAAEKSLVSHATEDKDLQAEICNVIQNYFPAK